jgi:hypothetical protein
LAARNKQISEDYESEFRAEANHETYDGEKEVYGIKDRVKVDLN